MGKRLSSSSLSERLRIVAEALPAEVARLWIAELGTPAPRLPADLLARALGYEVQARALGGLPAKIAKQLEAVHGADLPKAPVAKAADVLSSGSTLVRSWGGKTYTVRVEDDGYVLDGRRYGSLSEIANEITGTRWSGPRFFGLTQAQGVARHA